MDKLLIQVGEIIKTKKINETFDLTALPGWSIETDKQLNQLIADKQICGIVLEPYFDGAQRYRTTIRNNHIFHILDKNLKDEAQQVLDKSKNFLSMLGYSKELQDYCREISTIVNKIIKVRSEFLDFNKEIIICLLKNTGIALDFMVGMPLYTYQLDGTSLVDDLIDLHSNCAHNLFHR